MSNFRIKTIGQLEIPVNVQREKRGVKVNTEFDKPDVSNCGTCSKKSLGFMTQKAMQDFRGGFIKNS